MIACDELLRRARPRGETLRAERKEPHNGASVRRERTQDARMRMWQEWKTILNHLGGGGGSKGDSLLPTSTRTHAHTHSKCAPIC